MRIIVCNSYGQHIVRGENYLTLFDDGSGEIKDRLGNPILRTQFNLNDGNILIINGITFPFEREKNSSNEGDM